MSRSSWVSPARLRGCATVDLNEFVSTSCRHTMSASGLSPAIASAIRFIALRVLAMPRVV